MVKNISRICSILDVEEDEETIQFLHEFCRKDEEDTESSLARLLSDLSPYIISLALFGFILYLSALHNNDEDKFSSQIQICGIGGIVVSSLKTVVLFSTSSSSTGSSGYEFFFDLVSSFSIVYYSFCTAYFFHIITMLLVQLVFGGAF